MVSYGALKTTRVATKIHARMFRFQAKKNIFFVAFPCHRGLFVTALTGSKHEKTLNEIMININIVKKGEKVFIIFIR